MKLENAPDSKLYSRTMTEVMESTRHGKLYRVASVHGQKMIVNRCRMRGGNLVAMGRERLTLERGPNFVLTPCEGDFCFVDNGPRPCWALWKVMG